MALDPESQRLIDLMAAANRPAWNTLSPQAARDLYLSLRPGAQGPRPADVKVMDRTIPGPAGELPVRLYRPASAPADALLPALVYAHGGGWVFGNLDSHDVLGIDVSRLAIGGDSAGGNLAAAVALWARDNGGPKLLMQLLAYPVTDAVARTESYRHFEDGYGLNAVTMEWFFDHYTPEKANRGDWRVSPLRAASLAGLPPALVVTAGYDPLRDEGRAYAWRLQQEGTQADLVEFGGMLHGFLSSPMLLHGARRGTTLCAAALREALVLRAQ